MKTTHLVIGGVLVAAAAYLYVNRSSARSEATAAVTAPTASSSSSSGSKPSTGTRILGALGAALTTYTQSGTTVYRSASNAAVRPVDLGDFDLIDTNVA